MWLLLPLPPRGHHQLRELLNDGWDSDRPAVLRCAILAGGELAEGALVAPMPGKVIKLAVAAGAEVEAGALVAVLEAMKMEHELLAPAAGTVAELLVAEGDQVDAGAALVVIA